MDRRATTDNLCGSPERAMLITNTVPVDMILVTSALTRRQDCVGSANGYICIATALGGGLLDRGHANSKRSNTLVQHNDPAVTPQSAKEARLANVHGPI